MKFLVPVKKGKGRGKDLQFPTLNFEIPEVFPYSRGIYAGRVYIKDHMYDAAIHFGPIPTFNETADSLEAFLLDAQLETPPTQAEIELIEKIREIEKFDNPSVLSAQINKDVAVARAMLK